MDQPRAQPSRTALRERCIGVFTVRDGTIHAVREYMDTLYAHRVAFSGSA